MEAQRRSSSRHSPATRRGGVERMEGSMKVAQLVQPNPPLSSLLGNVECGPTTRPRMAQHSSRQRRAPEAARHLPHSDCVLYRKKPTLTCAAAAVLIQASARKHPPALYPELRTSLDAIIATTSDLAELEQLSQLRCFRVYHVSSEKAGLDIQRGGGGGWGARCVPISWSPPCRSRVLRRGWA